MGILTKCPAAQLSLNVVLISYGQHEMINQQKATDGATPGTESFLTEKTAGIPSDGVIVIRHPDQERTYFFSM